MRPSASTGVHLFHQARHDRRYVPRAGCIKLSPSLFRPRLRRRSHSRSLLFRSSFPLIYDALSRRAADALAVVASVSITEIRPPPAHFRKCFQNISDELNPEYVRGRRCAARSGREGKRERIGGTENDRIVPTTPYPKLAWDLAKLQARPRPAANFGFIRHATASLIRAAF